MEELNLIKRYLKAYINPFDSKNVGSELKDLLHTVDTILLFDKKKNFITNYALDGNEKFNVIEKILDKKKTRQNNFFKLLSTKNRINYLHSFKKAIEQMLKDVSKEKETTIYSNIEISNDKKKNIEKYIQDLLQTPIKASYKSDPELIGGFIALSGNIKVDCSIKNILKNYQTRVLNTK